MQRPLALGLAAVALLGSLAIVGIGFVCGARVTTEPCATPEECAAVSQCVSRVHPIAPWLAIASVGAAVGIWFGRAWIPIALGLVAAGVGALSGFSLGPWGLVIGALLVASGLALPFPRPLRLAAAVCALAPIPLILAAGSLTGSLALVWVAALAPAAFWVVLAARWRVAGARVA